jgi:hypothetical protein
VSEEFQEYRLESWFPRWISIDWGYEHPSAVYWHTMLPDRRILTYREFLTKESGSLQKGLSPPQLGRRICELNGNDRITEVYLSPDAFAHRTAEASIAEQLGEVFAANGLPHPSPADDDRIGGWQLLYSLLEGDAWLISERCEKLIENLPMLVRDDPPDQEDIRKVDGDDAADAARYGIVSAMRSAVLRPPVEHRVETRLKAAEERQGRPMDPTSRAIWAQKYAADELKKTGAVVRKRFRGTS